MRVLMVSKACLVGTYQTKLEAIAQYEDVELAVIVPPSWDDAAGRIGLERSHTRGYKLWVEPLRLNGNFHLHYYPTLGRRMREFGPDVLHVDEEPYNLATWLAVRTAVRQNVPALFFTWQNLYKRYPVPFRWMEGDVLRRAAYGLMGNRAAVDVFRRKGFEGRCRVIPQFGVSPALFAPPVQRHPDKGFVIGAAGRLVEEKGLAVLLAAVARLRGAWRLQVVGDGPLRGELVAQAEALGIGERVFFEGAVPSVQMPGYLQTLDVLVLPSRTRPHWKEQFGRILIEAMACETAVVGSDSGEIPHVVGEAGLIFAEDDVAGLAEQLQYLLQNRPVRDALGKAGRARVLANYTQAQIAAQTVGVYREIVAG